MNAETEIRPVLTLLRGGRVEGELPLVTIGPIDHLAEEDLETIRLAEFTHQLGKEDEAKAMIAALEQKLGITPADKAAAFGPQEPWEGDLLEALGLHQTDDGPAPLPHDPRRFNDVEMSQIERHDTARRIATVRGNRKTVAQAEGKLADIARGRDRRVDLEERREGIRETVQLAKARGEEVDDRPPHGAAHMVSRDGLKHLRQLGHLTDGQFAAGLAYRRGFEARGDIQAQQFSDQSQIAHDNDRFVELRLQRAKALNFLGRVERAVAVAFPGRPQTLQMLRWVAGQGGPITAYGKGRGLARNREALAMALDVAQRINQEELARREAQRIAPDEVENTTP